MNRPRTLVVILFVSLCLAAGFIGSVFTTPYIPTWYETLNKPSFNPPNWLFGPVWTTLYILMGIAASIVWAEKKKKDQRKKGLILFSIQLVLNVLWSIVFFTFQAPTAACVMVVALWIGIFLSIRAFMPISKQAAYLLLPYLAWVSFASILNFSIAWLN